MIKKALPLLNQSPQRAEVETRAAVALYQCLLQMADKKTNPVLLLLGEENSIMQGKKYPQQNLHFGDGGLVAYYHCHTEPYMMKNEHGHFHIFIKSSVAESDWTHLVALSIDTQGQPVRWFTVNHWVTAGCWLSAEELKQRYLTILDSGTGQSDLLQDWLFAMLCLYQTEIIQLLSQRDTAVQRRTTKDTEQETVLNDRQLYDLSEVPIDLLSKLGNILELE